MKLIQCRNGHYYDNEKYADCPYCGTDTGNIGITVPLNQGADMQGEGAVSAPADQETPKPDRETVRLASQPAPAPMQGQEPVFPEPVSGQWRAPQVQGGDTRPAGPWRMQEEDNRTVSYYSRTIGTEPVVGWLVAIEGSYFGESFRLKTGRNFVGRSPEMDVQLSLDNSVSRQKHAIIIYEPKARKFIAQPGDSRELFYLNDEVVLNNMVMKAYDVLTIGETRLLLAPLCGEQFSWEELSKKQES